MTTLYAKALITLCIDEGLKQGVLKNKGEFEELLDYLDKYFADTGKMTSGSSEIPNDLEEAADDYIGKVADDGWEWETHDIVEAFIAGAKWQENKDQETIKLAEDHAFLAGAEWQKEQDLAEMAQSKSPLSVAYANRCFENGKQAMKEQMVKEAVEGIVAESYGYEKNEDGEWGQVVSPIIRINVEKYSLGDKVRVIVLPKDDEKWDARYVNLK